MKRRKLKWFHPKYDLLIVGIHSTRRRRRRSLLLVWKESLTEALNAEFFKWII